MSDEPLPRHKVAMTVFADVEAVDVVDAQHIVERMLSQLGVWPRQEIETKLRPGLEPRNVRIVKVMSAGTAMRNGYLWMSVGDQAWREVGLGEREDGDGND